MKRSVLFGNNSPSLPTGPSGPFFLGGEFLGQYFGYPKPTELYRIADADGYGAVFSIRTVAFWAEILATSGPALAWTALLPMLINPPKVQQYAAEMEGV